MQLWRRRQSSEPSGHIRRSGRSPDVLIICDGDDELGLSIMENLCTGLDFGKVRFSILDIGRRTAWPALDMFDSIVICTELLWNLEADKASSLEHFVRAGGGLLAAYRCWNEHLSELFGAGQNGFEPSMNVTTGLRFDTEILPGAKGLRVDDGDWLFEHSRFVLSTEDLSSDCTILASDLGGHAIAWSRPLGNGKVVYWNTGVLVCRALRGFLMHSLFATMRVSVCAAAGFAMIHIDDFPTSLSDARLEPVSSEFPDLDLNGFFFSAWHEDMMALRAKHDLKYTWYTIMNYHDVTNLSADPAPADLETGRALLEQRFQLISQTAPGDEYGFHGYNHEPMTVDAWPDLAALRFKLAQARELWEGSVPAPLPKSWVPANNWYHANQMRVLKEVFPEISVVCGLFSTGEPELGELREFGLEPWHEALLCLPRETYGYGAAPELQMMMLSQIGAMGVWSHFLHPDDVYDIPSPTGETACCRNPETLLWRAPNRDGKPGLRDQFDDWLSTARTLFPWLEFVTTSEAEAKYLAHVNNEAEVLASDEAVEIHSRDDALFYVRTRAEISLRARSGAEVIDRREVEDGVLHVVRCYPGLSRFALVGS